MKSILFGIGLGIAVGRLYRRDGILLSMAVGTVCAVVYGLSHYLDTRAQLRD